MIAIIGTSDRPCWLAEACKILLLLLLLLLVTTEQHHVTCTAYYFLLCGMISLP